MKQQRTYERRLKNVCDRMWQESIPKIFREKYFLSTLTCHLALVTSRTFSRRGVSVTKLFGHIRESDDEIYEGFASTTYLPPIQNHLPILCKVFLPLFRLFYSILI